MKKIFLLFLAGITTFLSAVSFYNFLLLIKGINKYLTYGQLIGNIVITFGIFYFSITMLFITSYIFLKILNFNS